MKHFPFGSSTAHRTDECQQWQAVSAGIPRSESGFAVDGTIIHGVLESFALGEGIPDKVEGHTVEPDHVEMAQDMWAETNTLLDTYAVDEIVPEVTASTWDDVGGTLDLVALSASNQLLLIDYKTGTGVQVEAENNKQILFAAANMVYGKSEVADWVEGVSQFVGVIIQPDRAGDIQVKEWTFDINDVQTFWDRHLNNINLAREGKGDLKAGSHCKFCPAQGICPATTGQLLRMQQLDPERTADLVEILNLIEPVKETIRAAEKLAYEQLEVGVDLPGWKLVRGRKNRAWADPDSALRSLRNALRGVRFGNVPAARQLQTKPQLVTPAAAEKLLKKADRLEKVDMGTLAPVPESNTFTLAPESDKREAVPSAAAFQAALDSVS